MERCLRRLAAVSRFAARLECWALRGEAASSHLQLKGRESGCLAPVGLIERPPRLARGERDSLARLPEAVVRCVLGAPELPDFCSRFHAKSARMPAGACGHSRFRGKVYGSHGGGDGADFVSILSVS